MKLSQLRTREGVADDSNGPVTHFTEAAGYTLTLEQGTVTITGPRMKDGRILPWAACTYATPAPKVGK